MTPKHAAEARPPDVQEGPAVCSGVPAAPRTTMSRRAVGEPRLLNQVTPSSTMSSSSVHGPVRAGAVAWRERVVEAPGRVPP